MLSRDEESHQIAPLRRDVAKIPYRSTDIKVSWIGRAGQLRVLSENLTCQPTPRRQPMSAFSCHIAHRNSDYERDVSSCSFAVQNSSLRSHAFGQALPAQ